MTKRLFKLETAESRVLFGRDPAEEDEQGDASMGELNGAWRESPLYGQSLETMEEMTSLLSAVAYIDHWAEDTCLGSSKVQLLLVEDNPLDAELMEEALHRSGVVDYEVTAVETGEDALEYLETSAEGKRPDIILLDLGLPGIDGHGVLKELHGSAEHGSIPIFVLTGTDSPEAAEKSSSLGADGHLVKPSSRQAYMEVVSRVESAVNQQVVPLKVG